MDIKKELEQAVFNILGIGQFDLDWSLKDMGADSLDEIEIFMELETKFKISISDEDTDMIRKYTARRIIEYIEQRIAKD